ncbi:MAG: ISAs1 family transposase [Acidobacteriaceae bacterium]|nr:ISAs1 family transposase [Acidobacteriaceae bacterium]MBV9036989.1 ISAs1 family transposase [Acidobacteriaceae bacterium]MBV9938242.1 ISAs1 family transposase [Acidobacteriaceae bacterium]
MQQPLAVFLDHFSGLEDGREAGKVLHPVPEILLVTLCGVMAGAEGFEDIEDYGESKLDLLREFLPFAHGIPSDDTLRRFFRAVDPRAFAEVFVAFVRDVFPEAAQRLIAIDGKTLRRSHDGTAKALHLVSAFATEARLVLAQVATAEKSNEITAIPELLRLLDLRGATVSIDAMGCQREIATQIVEGGGHYLLGLKGNQGLLHEDVCLFFETPPQGTTLATHEEVDKGHGRLEIRRCEVTEESGWLQQRHNWPHLKSMARLTATRLLGDQTSTETRFYLTDDSPDPARILADTRSHWAIENTLHWTLDMSFGEDASRIRKENAPLAIATIRHVALNLLQAAKQPRESIRRLRKKAGWDNPTLKRILKIS